MANLRQELAEAKETLNKQVKETIQQKTTDAIEVQKLKEVIKIFKEQNAKVQHL